MGVDSAQILRASNFTFPFCIQCFKQMTLYTPTGLFKPSISNCRCILRKSDLGKKFLVSSMFLSQWAYNLHISRPVRRPTTPGKWVGILKPSHETEMGKENSQHEVLSSNVALLATSLDLKTLENGRFGKLMSKYLVAFASSKVGSGSFPQKLSPFLDHACIIAI